MDEKRLREVRQRAEQAVRGMDDEALRVKAFEVILARLLEDGSVDAESSKKRKASRRGTPPEESHEVVPSTLAGRILALKTDGVFAEQRTLPDVREELRTRGFHYPLTTLSGAMQRLVRGKHLRRERIKVGKKQVWAYSNT